MLRRQSSLNAARLPVKHVYNIFVTLSETEGDLYKSALEDYECGKSRDAVLGGSLAISTLKAILQQGTKIKFLTDLLTALRGSRERVVVISNYTCALDLMNKCFQREGWPLHRLDGQMSPMARTACVNSFNDPDNPDAYILLLSSKAGGCGLNLQGASRLIMYDPDWNPANDQQAFYFVLCSTKHACGPALITI